MAICVVLLPVNALTVLLGDIRSAKKLPFIPKSFVHEEVQDRDASFV